MNRLTLALFPLALLAQDANQIMAEVQKRTRAGSERYEGVLTVSTHRAPVSEKRWTYTRIGSHGSSRAVLRFTAPAEVKGVALLVVNHAERASDQWMWTPAIQRERRIALQDRSTRFFGTGFSFEDLEERDVSQYEYKLLGEEVVDGVASWKLESRPRRTKASQYTHSYVWVRKDQYAIERIEAYNKDKLTRRIDYGDFRMQDGIFTPRRIEVDDAGKKSQTLLRIDNLQYNVPLNAEEFTVQALRRE